MVQRPRWHLAGALPGDRQSGSARRPHRSTRVRRYAGPVWELFKTFSSLRIVYAIAELLEICSAQPPRPIKPVSAAAKYQVAEVPARLGSGAPIVSPAFEWCADHRRITALDPYPASSPCVPRERSTSRPSGPHPCSAACEASSHCGTVLAKCHRPSMLLLLIVSSLNQIVLCMFTVARH